MLQQNVFSAGRSPVSCGREYLAFILILAVAALLRWYGLGFRDFYLDEAYSFLFARDYSFTDVLSPMSSLNLSDRHPTLHYVLCWVWMRSGYPFLHGMGLSMEAAFRSFAAILSLGSLLMAIYCGRQIAGVRGGLLAGILLAFNGMAVSLAQEARMYSMLELAGACFLAAILRCQSDARTRWSSLGLLILASWFLMLSHYCGIISMALGWGWLFAKRKNWRRPLVIGAIVLTGLYAYWLVGFLAQFGKEQAGAGGGFKLSTGMVVPFAYFSFLAGETLVSIKYRSDLVSALPWIAATFGVAATGFLGAWRLWRRRPTENSKDVEAAAWLAFIPILVMLLGSFWVHKLFMGVRYAVAALVPFIILIAVGLIAWADNQRKTLATLAVVVYLIVSVTTLSNMYLLRVKPAPSWKAVAAYLRNVKPAAIAIYSPYMRLPLSLYYSGAPLIELPEQTVGSWDELIRMRPTLDQQGSDIVLILSHPKQYQNQYRQLFSFSGTLQPLKSGFFDVDLWLKPGADLQKRMGASPL